MEHEWKHGGNGRARKLGSGSGGHEEKLVLTKKNFACSGCIPALLLAGWNAYSLWTDHWEHWSHMPPLEERVEYPYQNIRVKNFPWGDGDKVRFPFPLGLSCFGS